MRYFRTFVLLCLLLAVSASYARNDAHFVSQSVPATLYVNDIAAASVTMLNPENRQVCETEPCCELCMSCVECSGDSGSDEAWAYPDYKLGSQNPLDTAQWGMNRVPLDAGETIGVGSSKTFSFTITAPSVAGSYNFQWKMVEEGVSWFGVLTPNVVINVLDTPKGYFDGADCGSVAGWACDPNDYSQALSVHFYADGPAGTGSFIGSATADQPGDAGVAAQCGGIAGHGFGFLLPASLKDGVSHTIYAYAINIPSGINPLLSPGPRTVQCSGNDAQYVSQSVPNPMCLGSSYNVTVTVRNSGSTTWTAANSYMLGSQNPQDNPFWGTGRVLLSPSDSIAPGQTKDYVFTVTPSAAGNQNFQWRMLREGVEWFGATTPNVVVGVNLCTATTFPGLPDLTIDDIYLVDEYGNMLPDPTSSSSASGGNLFYSIRNIGGSAAGASQSYVSWLDPGLNPLGNSVDDVVALPAATSSQEWLGLYDCPTPGHFFYWKVCADAANVAGEVTEDNNCYQERWWCPGIMSATSTTTSSSTTTTMYSRTVFLKYNVTGEGSSNYNCTLWTNISGSWINAFYPGVNKLVVNRVVFPGVPEGMYGWTVNCTDGMSPSAYAFNGVHNSPDIPGKKYRIFYIKAPGTTTTTTTTTTSTTITTTTTTSTTIATTTTLPAQADLVISDIWSVGSTIYYNLQNQGGTGAAVTRSSLTLDGSFVLEDNDAAIAAGASRQESFSYGWVCSGASDVVRVCADSGHVVPESNEANNCLEETWTCPVTTTTTTTTTTSTIATTTTTTFPYIIPGNSDVVLVTDLSESMLSCLNGATGGCTNVSGNNPRRIDYVKSLNKGFIDRVLSRAGNSISLVAFSRITSSGAPYTVGLSSNANYLKTQVDAYVADGPLGESTCFSCGIRRARKMLESSSPSKNKYIIFMTDGVNNRRCVGNYPTMDTVDLWSSYLDCCSKASSCGKANGRYMDEAGHLACSSGQYSVMGNTCTCAALEGGFWTGCGDYVSFWGLDQALADADATNKAFTGGVKIYTIGMFDAPFATGCTQATTSLTGIAARGGGVFFVGTSTSELGNIYNKF
ncbi:MAG: CARDB domain-containing protein [Candidatus Altiarchaeia archaeon]